VFGGKCDDSKGYFIEPTLVLTTNPTLNSWKEEFSGRNDGICL
jgi:1-pyrroline-5-carboxylate dehydrogenase